MPPPPQKKNMPLPNGYSVWKLFSDLLQADSYNLAASSWSADFKLQCATEILTKILKSLKSFKTADNLAKTSWVLILQGFWNHQNSRTLSFLSQVDNDCNHGDGGGHGNDLGYGGGDGGYDDSGYDDSGDDSGDDDDGDGDDDDYDDDGDVGNDYDDYDDDDGDDGGYNDSGDDGGV